MNNMSVIQDFWKPIKEENCKWRFKYSMFYTFCLGLFAHGFAFLNFQPSHDSLFEFFQNEDTYIHQIKLGRWLVPVYYELTGLKGGAIWSAGILALCWIALSVYFVSKIFVIDDKKQLLLLAGIFVTNRTVISLTATYMYCLGIYMLSLLFAVLSFYFWSLYIKLNRIRNFVNGVLFLILSMGLYQSYLAVTITLIIIYSITVLLKGGSVKSTVKNGCMGIIMVIAGGMGYFLTMNAVCKIVGVDLIRGEYNSISNVWNNIEPIWSRLMGCYTGVLHQLIKVKASVYSPWVITLVTIVLAFICICITLNLFITKKITMSELFWIFWLVSILPIGANINRFFNQTVHDLMFFAVWIFFIMPLLIIEIYYNGKLTKNKFGKYICYFLLLFVVFNNIQTANLVYIEKQIQFNASTSLMTNVLHDIEKQEGYVEGETSVVFIGKLDDTMLRLPQKESVIDITGVGFDSPITYDVTTYLQLLQRDIVVKRLSEVEIDFDIINIMPSYPENGYVTSIDGIVFVKFSNDKL